MTQRQMAHEHPLPACAAGHTSRHIYDARRASAGGGHFIECACASTRKHAELRHRHGGMEAYAPNPHAAAEAGGEGKTWCRWVCACRA